MAQADLVVKLIKSISDQDPVFSRKITEALIAEEKRKGHHILAERMHKALRPSYSGSKKSAGLIQPKGELFYETNPERCLGDIFLPSNVERQIRDLVEEQRHSELLHSYNLSARHRLLFAGPPGNGKTTLAEVLASELMWPLIVVRYESLIGSYLGETSSKLKNVLEYARTKRCVLFFDEFETLGKERGDLHETGEIKRIVSSLLLQTDALPDYVVLIAASNHPELLDRAVWRRFQVKVELPLPSPEQLCDLIDSVAERCSLNYGYATETIVQRLQGSSYAEAEQFCLDIARQAVLTHQIDNARAVTRNQLECWDDRLQPLSGTDSIDPAILPGVWSYRPGSISSSMMDLKD